MTQGGAAGSPDNADYLTRAQAFEEHARRLGYTLRGALIHQGAHYVARVDKFVYNDLRGAGTPPAALPGGPLSNLMPHERCTMMFFSSDYPHDAFAEVVRFQRRYAFKDISEFSAAAKIAEGRNKGKLLETSGKDTTFLPAYNGPSTCGPPVSVMNEESDKKKALEFWKAPRRTMEVYVSWLVLIWVLFAVHQTRGRL